MTARAPTVVLVHGAWADGSSWRRVIELLNRDGIPVVAAPLPLQSLPDDVAALNRAIDRTGGRVVVVGHAYAGAVIGASTHEQITALVYVAALAPDAGETVSDVFYREPAHFEAPRLAPDPDGFIWLPDSAFARAFAQHADTTDLAVLAAVQRPISASCIQEPVPEPGWHRLPTWYLVAEEDRMINPLAQAFMAERMGAQVRQHRVDHTPLLTAPKTVYDIVAEALQAAPS